MKHIRDTPMHVAHVKFTFSADETGRAQLAAHAAAIHAVVRPSWRRRLRRLWRWLACGW